MRSLILAAVLLPSAVFVRAQAAAPADWRRAQLSDAQRGALTDCGFRLQDDGRVLGPSTAAPLSDEEFSAALAKLGYAAQEAALERLSLLAASGNLSADQRAQLDALKGSLPDDAAKALAAGAPASELRRIAEGDLQTIANYFDASRTPQGRASDAAPVRLGDSGPRVPLPYFNPAEKTLGDGLRAAAAKTLSGDPVGRTVLARLNGSNGKPALPPIVVEDAPDGAVAEYNYRRRALVVDAETLRASVVGAAPAPQRAELRSSLATRDALIAYAGAHPALLSAFAAQNDALLAHELTHAWQDRRDPVMQEMSRGALPAGLIVDDEIEAWTVKNLYIASRLKNAPRAPVDPNELADFQAMTAQYVRWRDALAARYAASVPGALSLDDAAALQARRKARTRARPAASAAERASKSLDLLMQTRAERELTAARSAETARLDALRADAAKTSAQAPRLLALHYLAIAADAPTATQASADLQRAEEFATAAGDEALLARIRQNRNR
jgi:hypothetical protein